LAVEILAGSGEVKVAPSCRPPCSTQEKRERKTEEEKRIR